MIKKLRKIGLNVLTGSFFKIPHKYWEFQFQPNMWDNFCYFDFSISWSKKTDHAGFKVELYFIGILILFQIYDNRHWDYEMDRWVREE